MQEEKKFEVNGVEKNIDIKATLTKFIEADEPEMSQEEAIIKYEENNGKKKRYSSDDDETSEEEEHLKRIKKELLASLQRVKALEEKGSEQANEIIKSKKMNVKSGTSNSIKKDLQSKREHKEIGFEFENEAQKERE